MISVTIVVLAANASLMHLSLRVGPGRRPRHRASAKHRTGQGGVLKEKGNYKEFFWGVLHFGSMGLTDVRVSRAC